MQSFIQLEKIYINDAETCKLLFIQFRFGALKVVDCIRIYNQINENRTRKCIAQKITKFHSRK